MMHLNLNTPITTLDINDPNTSPKRQKLPDKIKMQSQLCAMFKKHILYIKTQID